jgi:hypothetical protein
VVAVAIGVIIGICQLGRSIFHRSGAITLSTLVSLVAATAIVTVACFLGLLDGWAAIWRFIGSLF